MLPFVPIFPVYNFFRQNIWHSIFDQFHFHHIIGDEMSIIRQYRQRKMAVKSSRNIFGDHLNGFLREEYLKAQQVSQQISIFFKSQFHNEGGDCQKSYFEVFSGRDLICHPQKIQPWQNPPSRFSLSPRF